MFRMELNPPFLLAVRQQVAAAENEEEANRLLQKMSQEIECQVKKRVKEVNYWPFWIQIFGHVTCRMSQKKFFIDLINRDSLLIFY